MQDSYWHELYARRRDWAFDAHEKFLAEAGPGLKNIDNRDKHVTVVVYGTTQVGKTTLILHMLGVAEAHIERMAHLLRGGRAKGNSATATPLRYRRSKDAFWRIGGPHALGLDDDAAQEYFRNMRQKVESGQGQATKETSEVVDVYLPSICFDDSGVEGEGIDLRMVDLPGLDAENENEREHVSALASDIIPHADLVILAGRGDSLGFLAPSNLVLDELKDWQATPYRFRIVCTHAFTLRSTSEWLLKPELEVSVDVVREYMMGQLGTHDFRVPNEMRSRLFVLEIGQSWREVEGKNALLHARAKPLIDTFLCELKDSIRQAANPWFRLKSAYELPNTFERKYQSGRRERLRRICELRPLVVFSRTQLQRTRSHVKRIEERKEVLDQRRGHLSAVLSKKVFSAIIEEARVQSSFPVYQGKKSVKEMRGLVEDAIERLNVFQKLLVSRLLKIQERLGCDVELPNFERFRDSEVFASLLSKLEGYMFFDRYFKASSWEQDMALLRSSYFAARDSFASFVDEVIERKLEQASSKLAAQIEIQKRILNSLRARESRRDNSLMQSKQDRSQARLELSDYKVRMRKKIEYGQRFMVHMREAYDEEKVRRRNVIRAERNPAKRFQQGLMAPFLWREYMGMKKGLTA